MKNNSKGFTLIELLAVIVILAVIALIATPIILNLIERARKGAAESSAYAYIEAAEKAVVVYMMEHPEAKITGDCTVAADDKLTCGTESAISLELDVKGDTPVADATSKVTFSTDGDVTGATNLKIGNYVVTYAEGKATAKAASAS